MSEFTQPNADEAKKKPEDAQNETDDAALAGWSGEGVDQKNLVPFFLAAPEAEGSNEVGKKWLGKLAAHVDSDFRSAWDSSEEYRQKRMENYQILTGFLPKKSFPWDGCANVHFPIMLERYLRLVANVFVEIFSDNEAIFNVQPTGPDDQREAEILTLHGNWQLKNELTDFIRQMLRGLGEFFACGSVFCYSYRDTVKNRNRHDVLNCEDVAIPYVWTSVETDMSDVPYKVRILRKYRNELETLKRQKEWEQVDALLSKGPPAWDALATKVRDKAADQEGIKAPDEKPKRAPWILFEYHGWYRMPGEDRERPICATVDMNSKAVVKLYLREEEDWRDRMRFDRQTQEHAQFQQAQADYAAAVPAHQEAMQAFQANAQAEAQLRQQMQGPGVHPEDAAMVTHSLDTADPLQPPEAPQEPPPPKWLKEGMQGPDPVRMVPIEMFSHGVCFENPNGTMGLAPGMILADLNRLADEAGNRFYDSATLANIWSLIVPEGFDLGSSTVSHAPGKIFRVKNFTGDQLKNSIHELKAQPANPQLMDVVRMVEDDADSSVAAPGVLSGEPGKSGETFRGLATRAERATRQLSQAGLMFVDFLTNVLRNNARLNALFLSDDEFITIGSQFQDVRNATIGPDGMPEPQIQLSAAMYRRDYKVTFSADVRFSSQEEKISRNDEALAMIGQIPPLQQNMALLYAVIARGYRLRGLQELIPLLGPRPPAPTMPMAPPMPPPMPGAPPGSGPPGMPPGEMPPQAAAGPPS